jgi:hypothetical protein
MVGLGLFSGVCETFSQMGDVMRMIVEMLRKQGARKPPVSGFSIIFMVFYGGFEGFDLVLV